MERRYAVMVDFEPDRLASYRVAASEAEATVGAALARRGFSALVSGLYVGTRDLGPVDAVLAAQDLGECLPWFTPCLRAARLLRIEEDGDLMIALN